MGHRERDSDLHGAYPQYLSPGQGTSLPSLTLEVGNSDYGGLEKSSVVEASLRNGTEMYPLHRETSRPLEPVLQQQPQKTVVVVDREFVHDYVIV